MALLCLADVNFAIHHTMKKILVVFTGGTIGSTASDGTINTSKQAPFKLLQLFTTQYPNTYDVEFDVLRPLQILSENLAPAAWVIIIEAIESNQPDKYDGIIVTHGTDTLAYTAAALSFYFNALKKPLLLVSSDYPLENTKGNGLVNFHSAVEFIRQQVAQGVFVPYRNTGKSMQIHQGSRLTCSLQLSGDFYSVQGNSFASFDGQMFSKTATNEPTITTDHVLKPEFSKGIMLVRPYPGLDYSHLNLAGVAAILHDLYHSGTACVTEQWGSNYSLVEFVKRCKREGVTVYLAPAINSANAYQTTRALIQQGAQMIWNMSVEAAYVKLMLAYGNYAGGQQITEFLAKDIADEHVVKFD